MADQEPWTRNPVGWREPIDLAARQRQEASTTGWQATIPIVAAIGKVKPVLYAETVASIASKHRRVP